MFGIDCEKQEEKYTSQCSPHSVKVCKKEANKTNRKTRGLYVEDGRIYNADSVGAFNIMRKYLSKVGTKLELQVKGLSDPKTFEWIGYKFQVSV
jgi:putative transposase